VRPRSSEAGFSLIEILAVIVVLGLIVGVVSISWQTTLPRTQLNSAVRILSERIHAARSDAIARNLKFEIHYDIDNGTYWIETPYHLEGGLAESDDEDRRIVDFTELPETVRFHEITMSGEVYADGEVEWRFDELGASSDHLIVLYQEAFDRYFTIEVLALTGLVRFHDGYFEREPPRDADFD
jgi:prepilin-type N-terminal cleavage/methylation domain-containing protein